MKPPIMSASIDDAHQVTAVIATAFWRLGVAAWLVPRPDDRQKILYDYLRLQVEHALHYGDVLMTEDRQAVAVGTPHDTPPPPIDGHDRHLEQACGPYISQFQTLNAALVTHHPGRPHHHLMYLAVEPEHQNRGNGTALLDRYHRLLAGRRASGPQAGIPAYLVAPSPRSRALFARHGYTDLGACINLPNYGPRLWPMWWIPQ